MEPEIARRCKVCGAAIRARATFCPQCGVPLPKESTSSTPAGAATDASETLPPTIGADTLADTMAPTEQLEVPAKAGAPLAGDARHGRDAAPASAPVENPLSPPTVAPPSVTLADGTAAKRQRIATAQREASEDSSRPRAEKLRRASNVMLDEAAADPSLRFVLVAAVLILLSLLLLLLGRIL